MKPQIKIGRRTIGEGHPCYVVAELSANHHQEFDEAVRLVAAAKKAGADAVKIQTYTPDTLTLDSDKPWFRVRSGTIWDGKTLHELYASAYTPWEWHPELQKVAREERIDFFSSPFDPSAVDLLKKMRVPVLKIASFELVDLPLIEYAAKTGLPLIVSTGMGSETEIRDAIQHARRSGAKQLAILKTNSSYPAPVEEMFLGNIPLMSRRFGVPVGLSDHTLSTTVPAIAVALGACIVEKHFTRARKAGGPDAAFSVEPSEFAAMVDAIRTAEQTRKTGPIGPTPHERASIPLRRSLFVVQDVRKGERFTTQNVRSIRPGNGLPPMALPKILGRRATTDLDRGTPLAWNHVTRTGGRR